VVTDFQGGTTVDWVDGKLGDRVKGDLQGVERMMDFIFNDESPLRLEYHDQE
jgi:hypothetical protein